MVHGGTLLAILLYFRQEWKGLALVALRRSRDRESASQGKLFQAILMGTMPALVVALAFRSVIEEYARTPEVTVLTLSSFGVLLWCADKRGKKNRRLNNLNVVDGLIIGLAQAVALVPGVSRSGVTISAALFLGFARPDSARFSFLLSGPILALGTADGIYSLLNQDDQVAVGLGTLVTGIVTSFGIGVLCIRFFLRFLRSRSFTPFVLYRLGLAAIILAFLLF
jgi:undecaprenyl-diphosphatase